MVVLGRVHGFEVYPGAGGKEHMTTKMTNSTRGMDGMKGRVRKKVRDLRNRAT